MVTSVDHIGILQLHIVFLYWILVSIIFVIPDLGNMFNIYTATEGQLLMLKGIGPSRARLIMEERRHRLLNPSLLAAITRTNVGMWENLITQGALSFDQVGPAGGSQTPAMTAIPRPPQGMSAGIQPPPGITLVIQPSPEMEAEYLQINQLLFSQMNTLDQIREAIPFIDNSAQRKNLQDQEITLTFSIVFSRTRLMIFDPSWLQFQVNQVPRRLNH